MPFSLNFVKFMGKFCKVFAVYKQVRDSMAFLYQIAGILFLLSTTIKFSYLSKVSVLTVSKTMIQTLICKYKIQPFVVELFLIVNWKGSHNICLH